MSFNKPKKFDNNLIVVGAGAAGLVSSYIAATVKAKVTLIERHKMGGDCLNTGCVPSKAIIRSAAVADYIKRSEEFGIKADVPEVDFAAVMNRVHEIIAAIEPHDSIERYTDLGVNCVTGNARFISPWEVDVDGERLTAKHIILASGAEPAVPSIPGLEQIPYLTSDTVWELRELPKRLLVIGGGPIGCELAQAFQRLGAQVTIVQRSGLLPKEDEDAAQAVEQSLVSDGVTLYTETDSVSFAQSEQGTQFDFVHEGESKTAYFDKVLVATGRKARVSGMGLEELGVSFTPQGTVAVDKYMRTDCKNISAAGDVAGPYQFTHVASHQAWYASVNSLFGSPLRRFTVDYSVIPWVTYTSPEVARVGLNEKDAKEQGIAYEVTKYGIDDLDKAIAVSESHGFVKVLTKPGKDKILGVTIVGYHASELLTEFTLAMRHGLGLKKIMATIHPYPTLSEANKYTAGEWQKARKPEALLKWVERFHTWRRG